MFQDFSGLSEMFKKRHDTKNKTVFMILFCLVLFRYSDLLKFGSVFVNSLIFPPS